MRDWHTPYAIIRYMYKRILRLLTEGQRRQARRVLLAVVARALLDFAGVAALFPVLLVLMKPGSGRWGMLLLCGGVLLFVVLKNVLVGFLARIQSRFQLEVYKDVSRRMFCNYYAGGLLFLKRKGATQLAHEVNYAGYAFCQGTLASLFRLCGEGILALLMLLALFVWEPLAGVLLCVVFVPVSVGYTQLVRKRLQQYGAEEFEARRRQARTVAEAFRGYAEIEIARSFGSSLSAFVQGADKVVESRLRTEMCQLFPLFLSEVAVILGLALLIVAGRGDLGLSGGVFAIAAFRLVPAVRAILNAYTVIQNSARTLAVVEEGLQEPDGTKEDEPAAFTLGDGIELRGVGYAFPDGHLLFEGLDWRIGRGERVGIRGASGSGKSTLFNLLLGFLEPTEGEIWIGGRQLTLRNRTSWHRLVGYVPQEIFVMDGTLLENIALGQPAPDRAKAREVLEQVQLGEWVDSLPDGLDTQVGESGCRMSGGQKQRLGIARALYKDAEILFFDEATSALDNHTEQEINKALQRLSESHRELTMVIIAHRESSLAVCDRILDLEHQKETR